MTVLLIDGDLLVYRTGFASQDKSEGIALSRLAHQIEVIKRDTGATSTEIYVSDATSNGFRFQLSGTYKGNRKATDRPNHYEALCGAISEQHGAKIAWGEEADDALGIRATTLGKDFVVASIDKDLLQLPGRHYNWTTGVWRTVSEAEGRYRFYSQILIGDAVDNIIPAVGLSCPGVGKGKAYRYLEGCETHEEYKRHLWTTFKEYLPDNTEAEIYQRIEKTGQLVKVRTQPNEIWSYEYDYGKNTTRT